MKEVWYLIILAVLISITFAVSLIKVMGNTPSSRKRFKSWKLEKNKPCLRYLDALRSDYYMDYASLNASIIVFILFLVFLVVYTTCPSIIRDRILSIACFLALAFIVILITTFKIFHCYFQRSICGSNMCQSKP